MLSSACPIQNFRRPSGHSVRLRKCVFLKRRNTWRPRPCGRRSPPALHELRQRPRSLDRPSLPEPYCLRGAGRSSPYPRRSLCQLESGARRLVARPEEWKWSSVRAHLSGVDDALVTVRPVLDRIPHLKDLLQADTEDDFSELRRAEATGRPLGAPEFVTGLENLLGRKIARRAPGRKP